MREIPPRGGEVNLHDEPAWTLNDPRYVANYLIDEIEYLAFQMRTLMLRLETLERGIVKLRAMRQNSLTSIIIDFIASFEGNVFTAQDAYKAIGISSGRGKTRVQNTLSLFSRQGRIYKGLEKGTYTKNPPMPQL
jgi:hypothetical protein